MGAELVDMGIFHWNVLHILVRGFSWCCLEVRGKRRATANAWAVGRARAEAQAKGRPQPKTNTTVYVESTLPGSERAHYIPSLDQNRTHCEVAVSPVGRSRCR